MSKVTEKKSKGVGGRTAKFKTEIERLYKKLKGKNLGVTALAEAVLDNWGLDGEPPTADYVRSVVRALGGAK